MTQPIPDWNSIVDEHAERIFRIAYRILGCVHDAEDISQIVFTESFKVHQTNQVRSWTGFLVRLATLRSVDRIRSNRKEKQISDSDHFSSQGPQEEAVGRELAAWLRRATASLPEQQAAVFSLAHYEQLDRNEIAAVLSIPPESVSTALYKARQNLQSQLNVLDGGSK